MQSIFFQSGQIARELHFVDHNVRTKLDELKRRELERLRHFALKVIDFLLFIFLTDVTRSVFNLIARVNKITLLFPILIFDN